MKPQFLQPRLARCHLQLLYAICTVSFPLCILFPAATVVVVSSSISRRSFSLLPGDRTGTTLQEIRLHEETPMGIRHTITPTFISDLCFFVHFAFILHPQHYKEQCHRSRQSAHEKCKSKTNVPTNILHQALKIRLHRKINIRMACQNTFSWVQAEPVHNRSMMQNLKAKKDKPPSLTSNHF